MAVPTVAAGSRRTVQLIYAARPFTGGNFDLIQWEARK